LVARAEVAEWAYNAAWSLGKELLSFMTADHMKLMLADAWTNKNQTVSFPEELLFVRYNSR
jgi:hypothetical protein